MYDFVPIGSKLSKNNREDRKINIDEYIPMESPSSQYRFPLALPDDDRATSNWNAFARPRIRLGPGICIGIMKPPRTWTLIFWIGVSKSMNCPTVVTWTPDEKSYQTSCGI